MKILCLTRFYTETSVSDKVILVAVCILYFSAMDIKKTFGQNLKKCRKRAGLTQERLSEILGITPKHLSVIENGVNFVSAEIIEKASASLGVSAATFFYNEAENSGSGAFIENVDFVVEDELKNALGRIKARIRE